MSYKAKLSALMAALCIIIGSVCGMSGCGNGTPTRAPAEDGVLTVVCTTFPASEFASALLQDALLPLAEEERMQTGNRGDAYIIEYLYNMSGDMHGYEPTAADVQRIARADILVCVGGESEKWLVNAVTASGNTTVRIVKMMDVCEVVQEEVPDGAETEAEENGTEVEYDEHVWTSIRNDKKIVTAIADALCAACPAGADKFRENEAAYLAQLSELDGQFEAMVQSAKRKELLIADRYPFVYLMRDYGLTCWAAFPGCSSETQASFATQVFLVEQVKSRALPVVFSVDNGAGSVADTVSKETGAKVLRLWSGQTVPEGDVTYLQMLRENLDALTRALN